MYNDLKQAQKDFEHMLITIEKEFKPLSLEQLNFKSGSDSWSILECIQHLNLYCVYYNEALFQALENAKPSKFSTIKLSWIGKKAITQVSPNNTKQMKTFDRMNPKSSNLPYSTLQDFIDYTKELLSMIPKSEGKNLNQKLIRIEFFKWLKISIAETLLFMAEHEKRHIQQALRVKSLIPMLHTPEAAQ